MAKKINKTNNMIDVNRELLNLQLILKIPIDRIVDCSTNVKLFLGNNDIGVIPYFIVNNEVIFETDESKLNYLKWDYIFRRSQNIITDKIRELIPLEVDEINIVPLNFKRLKVEDLINNTEFYIECHYMENEWQVGFANN